MIASFSQWNFHCLHTCIYCLSAVENLVILFSIIIQCMSNNFFLKIVNSIRFIRITKANLKVGTNSSELNSLNYFMVTQINWTWTLRYPWQLKIIIIIIIIILLLLLLLLFHLLLSQLVLVLTFWSDSFHIGRNDNTF